MEHSACPRPPEHRTWRARECRQLALKIIRSALTINTMRGEAHLSLKPTKLRRLGRERCEGATMTKAQTAIVLVIALSCVGVVADAVLKLASSQREVILSKWLFVGVGLSCVFAIGW